MACCGSCGCGANCSCNVCRGLCRFKFLSKGATAKYKPQKGLTGEELDTSNSTKNTSNPDSSPKRASLLVDMDMEGRTKNCCFGCNYKWTCGICGCI